MLEMQPKNTTRPVLKLQKSYKYDHISNCLVRIPKKAIGTWSRPVEIPRDIRPPLLMQKAAIALQILSSADL